MEKKINLEEILFIEVDKCRNKYPKENWMTNEDIKKSPEIIFVLSFAKEACRQVLELAAENVQEPYLEHGMTNLANRAKQSILDTIKQIEP